MTPARNPRNTGHGRLAPYHDFLIELIQQDPDITLKELQGALFDAHEVTASVSGIDQALKRPGYTYKKRASLRMSASAQGYLSTILDDYSRYIIAWKLCTTMKAADVTDTLDLALDASGCNRATVVQKPRRLSDNGSSYVAVDLADYPEGKGMDHVRGAPHHPQTQGKIERWHQTMKNRVLLENDFLPGDLERQIGAFVDHYNNRRDHESLDNLTPADVYHGRGAKILKMREEIKKKTIAA